MIFTHLQVKMNCVKESLLFRDGISRTEETNEHKYLRSNIDKYARLREFATSAR